MITYFTEQDLVSFGNFILSPERAQAYLDRGLLEENLPNVLHTINVFDLEAWITYLQKQKKIQEEQIKAVNKSTQNSESSSS